jgi:cytochrome c
MLPKRLGLVLLVLAGVALLSALLAMSAPVAAAPTPGNATPAPTVDRLAAPLTVPSPNQADLGAQLFWLHCQPCHGDQAQGLTDDWRAQYPPVDQDCWKSGCHGDHPYPQGFTLPKVVPALVGPGTLGHFATAADLFAFMSHAMPFQAPGSLKPEEYWAITAFLLRGHGLGASAPPINDAGAAQAIALGTPGAVTPAPTPSASPPAGPLGLALAVFAGLVILGGAGWLVWRTRRQGRPHG